MKETLLATLLSAFVWPGAGQLYNKEIKKGWILIGTSLLVMFSLSLNLSARIRELLPENITQIDTGTIRSTLEQLMRNPPEYFKYFNIFMSALWAYSVVDAFFGARHRNESSNDGQPSP